MLTEAEGSTKAKKLRNSTFFGSTFEIRGVVHLDNVEPGSWI